MSRICRPVTETLFVVCPVFMLFKDIASERKQSLLWFPERSYVLCKDNERRVQKQVRKTKFYLT